MTSIWAGRSVFVTGHTGFKGSWLCLWLHARGARITGYALPAPTRPSNFEVSAVRELLASHHEADIRDRARLADALKKASPDVIFHLAAQPLVREAYRAPYETFEANVLGTASVLDAVRALGKPCAVVIATSDKCYEMAGTTTARSEADALGGHDPYSASKAAAEIVVDSYRRSFFPPSALPKHGVAVATVRAGNVIGGGDWARDRIVTDMVAALTAGEPVPVRNPAAIRPWQHVLEPLGGYLALAERMVRAPSAALCGPWNFGPMNGKESPVRELVERFIAAWGCGSWIDRSDPSQPHETPTLRLSIDKAVRELGWRPRWDFKETVERTAGWYRACREKPGSMRSACLDEIAAYERAGGVVR